MSEDRIPRGAIRFLVGNRHVSTPDAEIATEIRDRLTRRGGGATDAEIAAAIEYALGIHHENQTLVRDFRL